ncbi:MAG: TIM barrel protein [Verrucomicrobiae bacterium]|nr:TIM barrel protein [Verrucomicrobiae bacterium]
MNRRQFNKVAAISSLGLSTGINPLGAVNRNAGKGDDSLSVNIFSKHLQFLGYSEMAKAAADMGFDGIDLSVRPRGHVEPANVERDLPVAVEAIVKENLNCDMMTTAVSDARDASDVKVLRVAARHGIKFYRTGYYKFTPGKSWKEDMGGFRQQMGRLSRLNKKLYLHGAYQNHSGFFVGAFIPDVIYLLEGLDPRWSGCQYDIRHATVEGGLAWPMGVGWLEKYISTIVIKDFAWSEKDGKNVVVDTPVGEGIVDFIAYFKLLRKLGIHPVVSLHAEYDLGGAHHGRRELTIPSRDVFKALAKDLAMVRDLWKMSGST